MLLKNKVAIITGCARGIGKEILKVFSENGATVFACVRVLDKKFSDEIKDINKKTNNKIIPIQLDFSKEEQIKNAADKILSLNDSIDILVNNAGIIHTAIFQMTSNNKLKEIFDINYFAQSKFTQYISKSMMKKKSVILFIYHQLQE